MLKRIQRMRTKGWRMPANAIYVGRPTIFGNPWDWRECPPDIGPPEWARGAAVDAYRDWLAGREEPPPGWLWRRDHVLAALSSLRGKDLCCWCPLDHPCHADVLLARANARTSAA